MKDGYLEAKDLMIGDIVRYNYQGTVIKVENVHGNMINYSPDIPYCQEEFYIEEKYLSPIPITPEILKMNGFVYGTTSEQENCGFGCTMEHYYILEIADEYCITWINGGLKIRNEKADLFIDCKFVHQLQHALRLCGLTDLAENFKV